MVRAGRGPREAVAARARRRLVDLVRFARARCALYRDLYRGVRDTDFPLESLPPVTRADLEGRFDAWVADPEAGRKSVEAFVADEAALGRLYLDRYLVFATSGTAGRPFVFLHDRAAARVYLALLAVRRLPSLAGLEVARSLAREGGRAATVVTTGGHFASSVIEALARRLLPRLAARNRVFSLFAPLPDLVRELEAFRPAVLGSYATVLFVLAGERAAGRLRIRPGLVLSGAERLSPEARAQIEAAFGCPVRDTYAASEFPGIAFDCRAGRLHVNADWVILEAVDAAGRPVPPGVPSHTTLLTNLANRVAPLIRYDLGDSVTFCPDPCPCKSPLPAVRVEGRRDEVLSLAGAAGEATPLFPLVLATVMEATPGLRAYQVIRRGPARLLLRLEEAPGHDRSAVCAEAVRRLRAYLASQGLGEAAVEVAKERPRREERGGKLRQFFAEG